MSRGDFWSRRKAGVEAEEAARDAQDAEIAREAEAAEKTDTEILDDLGLPDPDTLGEGDDFSGFMTGAVPTRLRNRALRRLWTTNPVLANIDGLVDYGEDFTDAALVVENMQTAYQVGKGMTKHVEEMLRQAEAEAAQADVEDPMETDDDDAGEDASPAPTEPLPDEPVVLATNTIVENTSPDAENDSKPRRMRYSFATDPGEDA